MPQIAGSKPGAGVGGGGGRGGTGGGGGKGSPVPVVLSLLEGLGAGTATGLTGNPAFIQGLHAAQQDARRMAFQQEERERDEIAEAARSGSASFLSSPEVQRRMSALGMDPAVWAPIAQSAQRNRMMEEKQQGLAQQASLAQIASQRTARDIAISSERRAEEMAPFERQRIASGTALSNLQAQIAGSAENRALEAARAEQEDRPLARRALRAQLGAAQTDIAAGKERILASREERAGRRAGRANAALASLSPVFPNADPAAFSRVVTAIANDEVPRDADIQMLMRDAPPGVTPQALQHYLDNRVRVTQRAGELATLGRTGQLDEASLFSSADANNNDALAAIQVGLRTGTISPERAGQEARETMTFFSADGATRMGLEEAARREAAGERIAGSPLAMAQSIGDQALLDSLRPPPPPPAPPQGSISGEAAPGAINAGEGVVRSRMDLDTMTLRAGRADLTDEERNQLQLLIQAIRSTAEVREPRPFLGARAQPPVVFGDGSRGPNQRLTNLLRGAQRLLALPSGRERGTPRRGG